MTKRALKWTVEWGMAISGLGFLYRHTPAFREGCRILTYHCISEHCEDSYSLKTEHFETHMHYLSDHHPVVPLTEMLGRMEGGSSQDAGSVAITFDDGYEDAGRIGAEILDKYRLPATFYVVTGILDGTLIPPPRSRFMSWTDVKHMAAAGFEIGSHTVSHTSLTALSPNEVKQELMHSRDRIAQEIGSPPSGLAYPYGTLRDFSPAIADSAREVGYRYAATAIHGLNHPGCNPFLLSRTSITAGDGLRTLRMIMKGNLDPWYIVDRWGSRLQRPQRSWA